MREVDCGDQLITLCNDDPKSGGEGSCSKVEVWSSKVEVCLLNGYALEGCAKVVTRNVIFSHSESLIGAYSGRKQTGRKQKRNEDHQWAHSSAFNDNSLRDCVECKREGWRSRAFKSGLLPWMPHWVQVLQCSSVHHHRPWLFFLSTNIGAKVILNFVSMFFAHLISSTYTNCTHYNVIRKLSGASFINATCSLRIIYMYPYKNH